MPISLSLTYLYPIFESIFTDSVWAVREHSYQLSNTLGYSIGGRHVVGVPTNEHTHSIKVNLIIDKVFKKSYIILQMKGTHDGYN